VLWGNHQTSAKHGGNAISRARIQPSSWTLKSQTMLSQRVRPRPIMSVASRGDASSDADLSRTSDLHLLPFCLQSIPPLSSTLNQRLHPSHYPTTPPPNHPPTHQQTCLASVEEPPLAVLRPPPRSPPRLLPATHLLPRIPPRQQHLLPQHLLLAPPLPRAPVCSARWPRPLRK
jgi:hypothetical protein